MSGSDFEKLKRKFIVESGARRVELFNPTSKTFKSAPFLVLLVTFMNSGEPIKAPWPFAIEIERQHLHHHPSARFSLRLDNIYFSIWSPLYAFSPDLFLSVRFQEVVFAFRLFLFQLKSARVCAETGALPWFPFHKAEVQSRAIGWCLLPVIPVVVLLTVYMQTAGNWEGPSCTMAQSEKPLAYHCQCSVFAGRDHRLVFPPLKVRQMKFYPDLSEKNYIILQSSDLECTDVEDFLRRALSAVQTVFVTTIFVTLLRIAQIIVIRLARKLTKRKQNGLAPGRGEGGGEFLVAA